MTVWSKSLASRSLLATNHQTELGVSFKHLDSIHDMHSSRLQRLCPHDVTLFIETSCCKLWEENIPKLCILPFNSTSTVTSISFCAASSKCATIGLLDPTRYKVTFFTFLGEKKKLTCLFIQNLDCHNSGIASSLSEKRHNRIETDKAKMSFEQAKITSNLSNGWYKRISP